MSYNSNKSAGSKTNSQSSVEFQKQLRVQKMQSLQALNINPFEVQSKRDYTLYEVKLQFENQDNSAKSENLTGQSESQNPRNSTNSENQKNPQNQQNSNLIFGENGTQITLAGRVKSKRVSGKIAFATLEDESNPDGFQLIFRRDFLSDSDQSQTDSAAFDEEGNILKSMDFEQFKNLIDEGDYLQATGYLDKSQRGEPSLFVQKFTILTKSLRPLPEELDYQNVEARYLDRVVDYKMNTLDDSGLSVREVVRLKSVYWQIWREEMLKEGFTEVYNPIFEHVPGGAEAKPFTTFYNELDQEMFMRISLELPLKKLIAGGFEKVFEIGRIFRNEGASPQHLQEYTQIEWYNAYSDYNWAAQFTQRVYQRLVLEIVGKMEQTDYYGNQINWGAWCDEDLAEKQGWEMMNGWPKITFYDAVRYFSNNQIDVEKKTATELVELAKKHGITDVSEDLGMSTLMDKLWKIARQNTTNPFFLILPPVELEPLAKRDPQNPQLVQRWQIVAGKSEHGKAFSELNDPIDQLSRFEEQQAARDAGNEEAQFMDEDYVKSLELGLPPLSGFGVSERLFSFLLGKHIKECVTFPYIKKQTQDDGKKQKTMVAHAIILRNDDQPLWSQMNAVAHLSAAFAAREGRQLIQTDASDSADGITIPMNIAHAIIMKQTDSTDSLKELALKAQKLNLEFSVFTEDMRNSSNDDKVIMAHSQKSNEQINYLGVLIFGKKSTIEEITEEFERVE